MKSILFAATVLSATVLTAFASPALAETTDSVLISDTIRPEAITVLATGSALSVDKAGQPVTVVTAADLDRVQGLDITRALALVPGLSLSRNGGPGAFTGVRLRGSDSEQVLVLVDGVRVEDVSGPSGGFDFGTLTPGGIDRIDVLRGSNSVVWGSAAIGGVIAVSSADLNGVRASAEAGSHGSYAGDAAAGIKQERYALTLNAGLAGTDGVSSAASGTEGDGFRQWRVGGKGRYALTDTLSLVATGRYADTHTDIDGYPAPTYTFGDTPEYQITRQFSGRAGVQYRDGGLTVDAGYAHAQTARDYYDPTYGSDVQYGYRGYSERADLSAHVPLPQNLSLNVGADSEWTRFQSTYDARQRARLTSGHALLTWDNGTALLAAGARVDDHSRFGTNWTFGANGSVAVAQGLRLRASYGEAFKAPTLYQLFSDYGNGALVPERSRSYDAGIEWASSNGLVHATTTLFRRDTRNQIGYVSCFSVSNALCNDGRYGFYDNVGKARAQGVEAELRVKPIETVKAAVVYTYLEATNRTPGAATFGKDLARRPHHSLTTMLDWTTPLRDLALGADVTVRSASYDNASNTVRLQPGVLLALRASLPVAKGVEVYGRVENLLDQNRPTAAGYGTWGRAAFGGLRVRY
ncbi:TonB-dependent receptor plug domain-containing protein [Novosphingobium sp.]|uniref:TonB-dependent receptor plug domain-containing protein n=1 Tax=Novosphingobium sp. TaxID=1874826 RepID=UPI0038BB846F